MMLYTATCNTQRATYNTRSWWLIAFLLLLFLGPLIAPLFQATGLPFVADSGALARDMLSRYICPTPAKSYALLEFPMAVCARCWGATIGLWGAWFVPRRTMLTATSAATEGPPYRGRWLVGGFIAMPWALRLCLALGALLLWTLEINAWPTAPLPALIVNGANGGFWAGMFVGSLWLAGRAALTRRVDPARR
jgi:hypothetical protein